MSESMEGRRDPRSIKIPPRPMPVEQDAFPGGWKGHITDVPGEFTGDLAKGTGEINVASAKKLPPLNYKRPAKPEFAPQDRWQNTDALLAQFDDEDRGVEEEAELAKNTQQRERLATIKKVKIPSPPTIKSATPQTGRGVLDRDFREKIERQRMLNKVGRPTPEAVVGKADRFFKSLRGKSEPIPEQTTQTERRQALIVPDFEYPKPSFGPKSKPANEIPKKSSAEIADDLSALARKFEDEENANKLEKERQAKIARVEKENQIKGVIYPRPDYERGHHPKPFAKDTEGNFIDVKSGFINNKTQPKNKTIETGEIIIDHNFLKTDAELREDDAIMARAQEPIFRGVKNTNGVEELKEARDEAAKELERSEEPLFTIEKFEADLNKSKKTAEDEAFKKNLRDKILSEEAKEPAVLEKIRLETEMKKAKLTYIWAYKKLYPKFANEPEDDISKFPPPKFTFLSKDKQNLIKLHQAALDAEEEWLHAQGVGFVNKNVKESKVKFHSEPLGEPGDIPIDSKKLKKAEEKNLLALAKEERRNTDTDNYLNIQAVLDPEFLLMKEKPNLAAVRAKAEFAKSVYAKAYREMFPEQFPKDKKFTNDFISLLAPPKVGFLSFNKDKKRLLVSLYEVVQQAMLLEDDFQKSK